MADQIRNIVTGYGARHNVFDGDAEKYELWEVKLMSYLRLRKLLHVVESEDVPDVNKNAEVFAELVQFLDDRSLSLIIRDAKDKGREAIAILREHYLGKSKPRVISLYTELTSLRMGSEESVTDYVIRAEKTSTSLKSAGEVISDGLLVAMVLKGLPSSFKTFSTVISQKEKQVTFTEFKISLRSFEETERGQIGSSCNENVMHVKNDYKLKCFNCGKPGHIKSQCTSKPKNNNKMLDRGTNRWCSNCRSNTHDTDYCRRNSAKSMRESSFKDHSYAFKISIDLDVHKSSLNKALLVDCGATTHIINDKKKFVQFDKKFDGSQNFIELADGSRSNGLVQGRGDASVSLFDSHGNEKNIVLKNALYVPSYNQDIFSVHAATERGCSVNFDPDGAKLEAPDETIFDITKSGKLYFLNNIRPESVKTYSLTQWHKILGHCNNDDVIRLESVVDGMKLSDKCKLNCSECIRSKMPQFRNREPDRRALKPLDLVHCDLAGPIKPAAKDGFLYAMCLVDDYSGIRNVYFLKNKSDATSAMSKYLSDISPYGVVKRFRSDNGGEFVNGEFEDLLLKYSIKHERTAPHSPHQNGTVERSWRTLFDMTRCLLLESRLPKFLWTYALRTATYIRNRCFNNRLGMTPFEALTGIKPNLSNMHIFGCECYAYVQIKSKLDPRSEQGYFAGYDHESPAYLVYFPDKHTIKKVRCVKFFDQSFETLIGPVNVSVNTENNSNDCEDSSSFREASCSSKQPQGPSVPERRYPSRDRRRPPYLEDYVCEPQGEVCSSVSKMSMHYCYKMSSVLKTYNDAIYSDDAK